MYDFVIFCLVLFTALSFGFKTQEIFSCNLFLFPSVLPYYLPFQPFFPSSLPYFLLSTLVLVSLMYLNPGPCTYYSWALPLRFIPILNCSFI
jgi:hypothetical protein